MSVDFDAEATVNKQIICDVSKVLYARGLITVNGGGVSIHTKKDIFYLPTGGICGILEDEIKQIFIGSVQTELKDLCGGAFEFPINNCRAVVHTHSENARRFAEKHKIGVFETKGNVNTKAIWNRATNEKYGNVFLPIIKQVSDENALLDAIRKAFHENATTYSVLVKDHGLFTFGSTWQRARGEAEAFEELFKYNI
ncbi:probable methylthioribulose-1-phosphate dehydratase [Sitodiplosis mosellana]|uniref:probable methylthioribulose-1-phosphate dehydratase n=1 Tax=Sitodiplosis mosellana TaxID=263140 RepID=UPI0024450E25|nr:probable methylthioribulose-1-phosphate dehydratase [Sitodiplosis mosellana]